MIQTQENNPTIKNKSAKCNVSVLHRANCILLGYYSFDVATIGVEGSGKWGGGVPLPSRLGDLGERGELSQPSPGLQSPGLKRLFRIFLNVTDTERFR